MLLCFFCLVFNTSAYAGTLNGTVRGKTGQIKKYVRVEIGGPETKTTFTDEHGVFSVQLLSGAYIINIVERNRSMKFNVDILEAKNPMEKSFNLKW